MRRVLTGHVPREAWSPACREGGALVQPMAGSTTAGCGLYFEEAGAGVARSFLVHPAGSTASTWGSATEKLAQIGRVVTYDRRGYARSGGEPVRSMRTHTDDAAALLEQLETPPLCGGGHERRGGDRG